VSCVMEVGEISSSFGGDASNCAGINARLWEAAFP
jgi:hypothetical protein